MGEGKRERGMQMKDTEQRRRNLREEWARLYVDESEESLEAIELLRRAGFRVITFPVNGRIGPQLKLGRRVYQGLEEIQNMIEE